ncbi:hypothetical protein DFR79_11267 [Halanaerobium saccharolyticum]|uniref:SEC-C motif-containing protein n=1 Tax=Halanaerobium saccharolyticum TaxID=43595 RepID=A0A4R6LQ81_9FIRM|nr:hypothetical protein [Halanaerobium saccharolyticum]TDO89314.1 hypothetical protein DFR79_11267 [Halanaerobium saccharolyticum]
MKKDIEKYVREIENIIDVEHESFPLFENPRGKSILYLLRVFEDMCRLQAPIVLLSDSPESMDILIHNHLDKVDMAINWAYDCCKNDDFEIDYEIDGEFYVSAGDTLKHAGFYRSLCDSYILWSRGRNDVEVDKTNNIVKFNLLEDDNLIDAIALTYREQAKISEVPLDDIMENSEIYQNNIHKLIESISFDEKISYSEADEILGIFERISLIQIDKMFTLPEDWDFIGFTLKEFKEFWNILLTKCLLHQSACLYSGKNNLAVESVVLIYTYEDLCQLFLSRTDLSRDKIESIIDILIYDHSIRNIDAIWQPFFNLKDDIYAIAPNMIINNSAERNLITLINKIDQPSYSRISNQKEDVIINSIKNKLSDEFESLNLSFKTELPGELPDIDMACFDSITNTLFIGEIKWLIPTDSIPEVCARDEDLSKGISQIHAILEYLEDNLDDGSKRIFGNNFNKKIHNIYGCVISKNNLGSSALDDSIRIITEQSLIELFNEFDGNLEIITEKIESLAFLPEWNKDFKILEIDMEYAGFKFIFPAIRIKTDTDFVVKDNEVGRNDPCPCGAINPKTKRRMKYKRCCGN